MKKLILLISLLACLFLLPACHTTLATGGAYSGTNAPTSLDYAFYQVDAAFALSYDACDTAFNFERNNRAMLWKLNPDIKHTLDSIRPRAVQAAQKYAVARAAFEANQNQVNLDPLVRLLAEFQPLTAQAQAALTIPKP